MTKTKKLGRPSVLTEEMTGLYLFARSRGGNDADCAYYAGIHPNTVRRWRRRVERSDVQQAGETDEVVSYAEDQKMPPIGDLLEFFDVVERATAVARLERLDQIDNAAASGSWQAAAWWLERRYPDEYGRRERRDLSVSMTVAAAEATLDAEIARLEAEADGDE
jgi:hypothetical protein